MYLTNSEIKSRQDICAKLESSQTVHVFISCFTRLDVFILSLSQFGGIMWFSTSSKLLSSSNQRIKLPSPSRFLLTGHMDSHWLAAEMLNAEPLPTLRMPSTQTQVSKVELNFLWLWANTAQSSLPCVYMKIRRDHVPNLTQSPPQYTTYTTYSFYMSRQSFNAAPSANSAFQIKNLQYQT